MSEDRQVKSMNDFLEFLLQTHIIEAEMWVNSMKAHSDAPAWAEFFSRPIERDWVLFLAQVFVKEIWHRVQMIDIEELHSETIREGHSFLQEFHEKAVNWGVEVKLEEIDAPLSFTDAMVASGIVERHPGGKVALTAKGKQAADQVQAGIDGVKKK